MYLFANDAPFAPALCVRLHWLQIRISNIVFGVV